MSAYRGKAEEAPPSITVLGVEHRAESVQTRTRYLFSTYLGSVCVDYEWHDMAEGGVGLRWTWSLMTSGRKLVADKRFVTADAACRDAHNILHILAAWARSGAALDSIHG